MEKAHQLLKAYVDAGAAFTESVKNDVVYDGMISDETILKMNAFIIAQNALADLPITIDSTTEPKLKH